MHIISTTLLSPSSFPLYLYLYLASFPSILVSLFLFPSLFLYFSLYISLPLSIYLCYSLYPSPLSLSLSSGKVQPSMDVAAKNLYSQQGIGGFYRGIEANVMRAMVLNGTKMSCYDQIKVSVYLYLCQYYWSLASLSLSLSILLSISSSRSLSFYLCLSSHFLFVHLSVVWLSPSFSN